MAREEYRRAKAAVAIQRVWKGYVVRKEWKDNRERLLKQKAAMKVLASYRRQRVKDFFHLIADPPMVY